MAGSLDSLLKFVPFRKKAKAGGQSLTSTYNPSNADQVLSLPAYRDHLTDIFNSRISSDSRALIKQLAKNDPDVSATFNAYLTISNTKPIFFAKKVDGSLDPNGMKMLHQVLALLTKQFDYSLGFTYKPSLTTICTDMKYMLLMRGGIGAELVMDKRMVPSEIRHVDLATVKWYERKPGVYKPQQEVNNEIINLDIPTFFVAFHHKDPTTIYTDSSFIASINTIAARQQVINDLYRIMQITGFPRLDVKVLEEVVLKNAPAVVKQDPEKQREWVRQRLSEIQQTVTNIRPDQAFVHWDSVEAKTLNDQKPAAAMNIDSVITTLNDQNQAALKTMSTIIGRGESGVNTASVEARVFAMNCDELNQPVAEIWGHILTLALRMQGFDGYVECQFAKTELRPDMELEPQRTIKAARLKEDLSLGVISDDEYHIEMYGRPRPTDAPELSGTNFLQQAQTGDVNPSDVSPNSDPLGRSVSPDGNKAARSNVTKRGQTSKKQLASVTLAMDALQSEA